MKQKLFFFRNCVKRVGGMRTLGILLILDYWSLNNGLFNGPKTQFNSRFVKNYKFVRIWLDLNSFFDRKIIECRHLKLNSQQGGQGKFESRLSLISQFS